MRTLLILVFLITPAAFGTTRYVAATAGTFTGGTACNGQTAITPATWNSTAESPGDITWICGTITATAGNTVLTFSWDGSSGNRLVLNWDTGAVVSAPYFGFGGAVYPNGHSHILINGGTNGIIKTTANGTNLTYQQANAGIYTGQNGNDIEIENLTIPYIYQIVGQDVANESAWESTVCIDVDEGYNNVSIHNNTMAYCRIGIIDAYTTMTSGLFYNNIVDYSSWMLIVGDGANSSSATGVQISGNQLGPHYQAFIPADQSVHADGIFFFATNPGSSATGQVYNNYAHGDMCNGYGNCTAYLFVGSGVVNTPIFNNVFWQEVSGGGPEADVVIRGGDQAENNIHFVNNTMGGYTSDMKTDGGGGAGVVPTNLIFENNLFIGTGIGIIAGPANFNMISVSDHNLFYGGSDVAANQATTGPGNYFSTLSAWQGTTIAGSVHPDPNGVNTSANLNSGFSPQSPSGAIGLGINLTSLGITALDSDKNGSPRSATLNWDAGAVNNSSQVATPSISPTSGPYTSPQTVTITCPSGATCYYTQNGSTPTCSSTTYTGSFSQTVPGTVEAIGCEAGLTNSNVATANYVLAGPPGSTINGGVTIQDGPTVK